MSSMEPKVRSHTFHAFEVSVMGLGAGQDPAQLIWSLLCNAEHYDENKVSRLAGEHDGTGYRVELREISHTDDVFTGCVAKCREDAPPLRKADGKQVLQHLSEGETFLEKNYFRYERSSRILIWQFNLSGNGYTAFGQMLSVLAGKTYTFSCSPIIHEQVLTADVEIEFVDFTVSRPRGKRQMQALAGEDPADWGGLNPFRSMREMGAQRFQGKFTCKRNRTLGEQAIKLVTALSTRGRTLKLKLKLADMPEPIDVLTSRFKSKQFVNYRGHHLDPAHMLNALERAWDDLHAQAQAD